MEEISDGLQHSNEKEDNKENIQNCLSSPEKRERERRENIGELSNADNRQESNNTLERRNNIENFRELDDREIVENLNNPSENSISRETSEEPSNSITTERKVIKGNGEEIDNTANIFNEENIYNELDPDYVLSIADHISRICQGSNLYNLSKFSQVNKTWKEEVDRELEKRNHECIILPALSSHEIRKKSFHMSKLLRTLPHVGILFTATTHVGEGLRHAMDLEYDTYMAYRKQVPKRIIVVGVSEAYLDNILINVMPINSLFNEDENLDTVNQCGILSLHLPSNRRISVKESYVFNYDLIDYVREIDSMIDDLVPESLDAKSTLIIFVANPSNLNEINLYIFVIMNKIKAKFKDRPLSLLGFVSSYKICIRDVEFRNTDEIASVARIASINIFGPHLKSWSTIVYIDNPINLIKSKLANFKSTVHLQKNNLGFITCPIVFNESINKFIHTELIQETKALFPNISFIGSFCRDNNLCFGIDNMFPGMNISKNNRIACLLILSYD